MDTSRVLLIVCLTLFLVIGINAAIYVALSRKNTVSQVELFRRASQAAQDPWKSENDDLKELSRRVAELKEKHTDHE